jgi:hypothetical protein
MDIDILPPSDDRIFKLLLTSPEGKPALMDLISATIKRPVVDVTVRNNELPLWDTDEKAERLDVNCKIDDGSQVNLEMPSEPYRRRFRRRTQESQGKEHLLPVRSALFATLERIAEIR